MGRPLSIGGTPFEHGLGTHANSSLYITVNGATRFSGSAGMDGEVTTPQAGVEFFLLGDGRQLWRSGVMRAKEAAKTFALELQGVKTLVLRVAAAGDGIDFDHADWADASFEFEGTAPAAAGADPEASEILTPAAPASPRINGPSVVGARPGHPFFYHIPVTGDAPISIAAENLPAGLTLDAARGEITGALAQAGEHKVKLRAKNAAGRSSRILKIVAGDKIALTPPLGWNSWNCFAGAVDDGKIRAAADAMVSSGLINHGWTYINIDDCWEGRAGRQRDDPVQQEISRHEGAGRVRAFQGAEDRALFLAGAEDVRGISRQAGSTRKRTPNSTPPGDSIISNTTGVPTTGCRTSRCPNRERLMKPYQVMDAALRKQDRDIVFSLCQYGMGNVWEWGAEVGGNCWRTTGDIGDSWSSMSDIGFGRTGTRNTPGRAIGTIPTCWWWERSAGAICIRRA